MEDEEYRARVLAVLAPQLTGEKQVEVLAHGLEAALKIRYEWKRAGVLEALVPYLKGEMLQRVLEAAFSGTSSTLNGRDAPTRARGGIHDRR